ncbi:MAG: CBS domain-containing protein [Polyangiaceae bacterium]
MSDDKDSVESKDEAAEEGADRPSIEEVEPEVISSAAPAAPPASHAAHHHPPPPPRLRKREPRPIEVSGDPKLARDLMTRQLFTIGPEDVLQSLEQHMESFRFRHLPVIEDDKIVGLISHADLLHASSSHLTSHAKEVDAIVHKLPAKRIMHTDFTRVLPTTPLAEVAATMWSNHVDCVLVATEDGTLVGIITQGDFVRLSHHLLQRQA